MMDFKAFAETNARQEFPTPGQMTHWTLALDGPAQRMYRAACGRRVAGADLAIGQAPTCPQCRSQFDAFEAMPF